MTLDNRASHQETEFRATPRAFENDRSLSSTKPNGRIKTYRPGFGGPSIIDPISLRPAEWQERAACKGNPDFIVESDRRLSREQIEAAINICKICPVFAECKEWADKQKNWSGVVVAGRFYK
jgi:hypothetical protein